MHLQAINSTLILEEGDRQILISFGGHYLMKTTLFFFFFFFDEITKQPQPVKLADMHTALGVTQ